MDHHQKQKLISLCISTTRQLLLYLICPPHPPPDNCTGNHDWPQQKPRYSYYDPTCNPRPSSHSDGNIGDFVRYFARREIVASGLLQFNDKPQSYRAWKCSFENAVRGLDLTASEEMDLLPKWLGKESAEHVEQIRAIHINHPDAGLKMIWERLDQCYGSAEIVEDALFKQIDNFPKITNRDYVKLKNSVTYSWSSRALKRRREASLS